MRYFQHGETGRVLAMETDPQGDWYEIEEDQYQEALHPLSRPTPGAVDGVKCPRCGNNLNNDGYCLVCGHPFPPRH